jgi:hypothetical protein
MTVAKNRGGVFSTPQEMYPRKSSTFTFIQFGATAGLLKLGIFVFIAYYHMGNVIEHSYIFILLSIIYAG